MNNNNLTKESEFTVGEEKWLNYILAFLFFALFAYGVVDAARRNFKNIDYQSYVFTLAVIPAFYLFKRGKSKRIYIRINKTGIYQDEKLLTKWDGLLKAYLAQKEKNSFFNIQDNFQLVLEYRGPNAKEGIRRKIPLTNSQDKSEEDVLRAVNFFWNLYRKDFA
jgi:hypothetical protein